MSVHKTKQEETIEFVVGQSSALNGVSPFPPALGGGGAASRTLVGDALKPYAAAGSRQIAQQIINAEKTQRAVALMTQAAIQSVSEITYAIQVTTAIAGTIADPERQAKAMQYADHVVNFITHSHAQFLTSMQGVQDEHIRKPVEPSFWDRLLG